MADHCVFLCIFIIKRKDSLKENLNRKYQISKISETRDGDGRGNLALYLGYWHVKAVCDLEKMERIN